MVNNFNRVKLFNPTLCLKHTLDTIFDYLTRIQFPQVMWQRFDWKL